MSDDREAQRQRDLAAGWYRDEWLVWHGPPSQDRSNVWGVMEPRAPELPPHLRPTIPDAFQAAFESETAPDATSEASEAPRAVSLAAAAGSEAPYSQERAFEAEHAAELGWLKRFLRALLPDDDHPVEEDPKP